MKIILNFTNSLPSQYIESANRGKWYHLERVVILKTTGGSAVLLLNIFDRVMAYLYKVFNQNYFAKILNDQNVRILNNDELFALYQNSSRTDQNEELNVEDYFAKAVEPILLKREKYIEESDREMNGLKARIKELEDELKSLRME